MESPFADTDADAKGYPHRDVPPCQHRTPDQSGCRVACFGGRCVYLTHGNCPWPNWGSLTRRERDDYNRVPLAYRIYRTCTMPGDVSCTKGPKGEDDD